MDLVQLKRFDILIETLIETFGQKEGKHLLRIENIEKMNKIQPRDLQFIFGDAT